MGRSGRPNNIPQAYLRPNPKTCDLVAFPSTSEFANVIKVNILNWEGYYGWSVWVQHNNHKGVERRNTGVLEPQVCRQTQRFESYDLKIETTSEEIHRALEFRQEKETASLIMPPEEP